MNIYIWDHLDTVSESYHSDGGLVVVAESIEAARDLLRAKDEHGWLPVPEKCEAFMQEPTIHYEMRSGEPRVFVYPNAGCC